MSTGGGKINADYQAQQLKAQQDQNAIFQKMLDKTPEQKQFDTDSANWKSWLGKKDYSSAPDGDILNFDLWNPANIQKQASRMGDLEGIGAAGLGGQGDSSIALQLTKERNANQAAENAGANYEQAVGARNSYYEGNALPYATLETNQLSNLLGNSTDRVNVAQQGVLATRKQSLLPSIFGEALSLGGSLLGNPGLFASKAAGH